MIGVVWSHSVAPATRYLRSALPSCAAPKPYPRVARSCRGRGNSIPIWLALCEPEADGVLSPHRFREPKFNHDARSNCRMIGARMSAFDHAKESDLFRMSAQTWGIAAVVALAVSWVSALALETRSVFADEPDVIYHEFATAVNRGDFESAVLFFDEEAVGEGAALCGAGGTGVCDVASALRGWFDDDLFDGVVFSIIRSSVNGSMVAGKQETRFSFYVSDGFDRTVMDFVVEVDEAERITLWNLSYDLADAETRAYVDFVSGGGGPAEPAPDERTAQETPVGLPSTGSGGLQSDPDPLADGYSGALVLVAGILSGGALLTLGRVFRRWR